MQNSFNFDFANLYPNTIRAHNIQPENHAQFLHEIKIAKRRKNLDKFFEENNLVEEDAKG